MCRLFLASIVSDPFTLSFSFPLARSLSSSVALSLSRAPSLPPSPASCRGSDTPRVRGGYRSLLRRIYPLISSFLLPSSSRAHLPGSDTLRVLSGYIRLPRRIYPLFSLPVLPRGAPSTGGMIPGGYLSGVSEPAGGGYARVSRPLPPSPVRCRV